MVCGSPSTETTRGLIIPIGGVFFRKGASLDSEQIQTSEELLHELRVRIMELEGCLVYVKEFLPKPLKERCEDVLWTDKKPNPTTS
jgi:hypothetical protein